MTEDMKTVTEDVEIAPVVTEEDVDCSTDEAQEPEYSIDEAPEDYTPTEDESESTATSEKTEDDVSYKEDLAELSCIFSELEHLSTIEDIRSYDKYRHFRALGLSPKEAYLATGEPQPKRRATPTSPIRAARPTGAMTDSELRMAREIFSDLSDREITILYRMVTK